MTRILLALLLTTRVGCYCLSLPSQAEMEAFDAMFGHTYQLGWTLAFAGVGPDMRWTVGDPDLHQENGPGMEPTQSEPVLRAGDKPHDDSYP